MCEHNLLSSGYVAPLLNFHSPDSLYLQNLRGNGVHLSGLPQMSYSRSEVCSLPWSSPNSCTTPAQSRAYSGYSQPFFSNSAAVSASLNTHKKGSLEESGRYYFQDVSHKPEEPGRPNAAYAGEQSSVSNEVSNLERRQQNRVAQIELNSIDQPVTDGSKPSVSSSAPFQPSVSTQTIRTTVVSLTGEIKKKEKTLHEATVSRTGARIYDKRIYKPTETKGAFGQTGTK
ncbi:homeobox protein Hox-D12a isoform X2 [Ctenopharyngodon idella]|uniref:homeobox protein Hox-D12a isoform X2 n=1 Tax=Ctenopharyngodon idella TaxID=7959 RepID=UPI0022317E52|nr:homeobox protein Hox-D12a isoform X2 [Ctenopharyngodon idella]